MVPKPIFMSYFIVNGISEAYLPVSLPFVVIAGLLLLLWILLLKLQFNNSKYKWLAFIVEIITHWFFFHFLWIICLFVSFFSSFSNVFPVCCTYNFMKFELKNFERSFSQKKTSFSQWITTDTNFTISFMCLLWLILFSCLFFVYPKMGNNFCFVVSLIVAIKCYFNWMHLYDSYHV